MLTLDQIKNVTFTKSHGGYKTTEVDDFIDQCVDTVAGLIEERNASNKKLEVLADKLVEYRNDEDSIRSALVNAQRLGDTIVREANQKAELILQDAQIKAEKAESEAQAKADSTLNGISDKVEAEKQELTRLQREVALFKERMLAIYKEHLSLINVLPEEEKAEEPVAEEPAAEEPVVEEPTAEELPAVEEPETAPEAPAGQTSLMDIAAAAESVEDVTVSNTADENEDEQDIRFANLKFGEDYVIADDADEEDEKPAGRGFFRRKK